MSELVWITGASYGIGAELLRTCPWADARIISVSRTWGDSTQHVSADLSTPIGWAAIADSFEQELKSFSGERVALIHCAASITPIDRSDNVDGSALEAAVLLNSAAPQIIGSSFLRAVAQVNAKRQMVLLSSGAAVTAYPGLAHYCAGKAAVDQWLRSVREEQNTDAGVEVIAVNPSSTDTGMHESMRSADERRFPNRQKFVDLYEQGLLKNPTDVATQIWQLLDGPASVTPVVNL